MNSFRKTNGVPRSVPRRGWWLAAATFAAFALALPAAAGVEPEDPAPEPPAAETAQPSSSSACSRRVTRPASLA